MKFVMPEIEIIKFAEKDIITTSNNGDDTLPDVEI